MIYCPGYNNIPNNIELQSPLQNSLPALGHFLIARSASTIITSGGDKNWQSVNVHFILHTMITSLISARLAETHNTTTTTLVVCFFEIFLFTRYLHKCSSPDIMVSWCIFVTIFSATFILLTMPVLFLLSVQFAVSHWNVLFISFVAFFVRYQAEAS